MNRKHTIWKWLLFFRADRPWSKDLPTFSLSHATSFEPFINILFLSPLNVVFLVLFIYPFHYVLYSFELSSTVFWCHNNMTLNVGIKKCLFIGSQNGDCQCKKGLLDRDNYFLWWQRVHLLCLLWWTRALLHLFSHLFRYSSTITIHFTFAYGRNLQFLLENWKCEKTGISYSPFTAGF